MKQYRKENQQGTLFSIDGAVFNRDNYNQDYRRMIDEIAGGLAELLDYVAPTPLERLKEKLKEVEDDAKAKANGGFIWTAPNLYEYTIPTDRDARARYSELISAAREGIRLEDEKLRILTDEGDVKFVAVTNARLKDIFEFSHRHFKKCQSVEEHCVDLVIGHYEQGDYQDALAVDFNAEFDAFVE